MADPDRRPTAQEIEELIDLVRRDPGSPAFIDLGEAYLALGRPKDAVKVGSVGLEAAPDNLEGRVMLARAYAALHQWKEAQGELLRVVKVDRSNRRGFALLGEVLLRRNDFERAVPVLQHAQNLDPTSPQILSMLKRARGGQPLDPPPPLPSPVPPRGETNYGLELEQAAPRPRAAAPAPRPQAPPMTAASVPSASPVAPTMALQPAPLPGWPDPEPAPPVVAAPPAAPPPPRAPKQTAPPPMSVEGVRPRVVSSAKPQNAAAASLRQSAAVGESYLNDLLTGGLLDVAGVRVPDMEFDLRPDRRWGRSTRRAFIFLFVVLVFGIGGGGGWYYYSQKQQARAVASLQHEAQLAIVDGDFAGLETGLGKLKDALQKDKKNVLTYAYAAETSGLEALLYGTDTVRVDEAIKGVGKDIKPGDQGDRELVIGKASLALARLGTSDGPNASLADVSRELDEYLAKHPDDRWMQWLHARALLAAGQRTPGRAALKSAADGTDGLTVAMIDEADLLVDDGDLDGGLALYEKVLAKSKDHPLAILGRALARAESHVQIDDAIDDLNVKLDPKTKPIGPRVTAYRSLALSLAELAIEDYTNSGKDLARAVGAHPPVEPRFWARVAWAHYARGELAEAAKARANVAWYPRERAASPTGDKNAKPEDDPEVVLVDAALLVASGEPDKALDLAARLKGLRPAIVRAYADLDLGKAKDASAELDDVLKKSPENLEAQILQAWAQMLLAPVKDRQNASDALEHLARKAKSKLGRHALGMAYLALGDAKDAQPQLEQALADVNDDAPNPLAYRTHTALAQIHLDAGDLAGAKKELDAALQANSGYFPALALRARLALKSGDPDQALTLLAPIEKEKALTDEGELTKAEALCSHKGVTDADRAAAADVLRSIKDRIQPPEEVGRVAAVCDPKLPEELGVPVPPDPNAPKKAAHGRRRR
jgi:tetratricopeptide (TPR) repeat protein